jgi:hypothetical protein
LIRISNVVHRRAFEIQFDTGGSAGSGSFTPATLYVDNVSVSVAD